MHYKFWHGIGQIHITRKSKFVIMEKLKELLFDHRTISYIFAFWTCNIFSDKYLSHIS